MLSLFLIIIWLIKKLTIYHFQSSRKSNFKLDPLKNRQFINKNLSRYQRLLNWNLVENNIDICNWTIAKQNWNSFISFKIPQNSGNSFKKKLEIPFNLKKNFQNSSSSTSPSTRYPRQYSPTPHCPST